MPPKPSQTNRRRSPRRAVRYRAWVVLPNSPETVLCEMQDVSTNGARLVVTDPRIPEAFTLQLTEDGRHQRKCLVMWRSPKGVGVRFVSA